jgi:hypothetical protein
MMRHGERPGDSQRQGRDGHHRDDQFPAADPPPALLSLHVRTSPGHPKPEIRPSDITVGHPGTRI